MHIYRLFLVPVVLMTLTAVANDDSDSVSRGRYLVQIAGCNDCHTSGYAEANGEIAEDQWLLGEQLGFRGPWGTTYPVNLRLYMAAINEKQWLELARSITPRPPMPWFNLRPMTDDDLLAIYRYVRTLEPVGEPAPSFVPPDEDPKGPVILFP